MDRLTTDNRENNLQTLLNYAYAKDLAVYLVFGNDEDNILLDKYIAHEAREHGCPTTESTVRAGGCMECDCPIAILNAVSIQAAELRARLMMIEDILGDTYDLDHLRELMEAEKEGRMVVHPGKELCAKQGDYIYIIDDGEVVEAILCTVGFDEEGNDYMVAIYGKPGDDDYEGFNPRFSDVGKTLFFTREAAEAALAKDNNVPTKKEE